MRNGPGFWAFLGRLGLVATIIAAGVITIVGSNGGGGGGGDSDFDLLPSYFYRIERGVDGTGGETNGITVEVDLDGTAASLRVDPDPVVGTYMCEPATDECELATIDTGTTLNVFDESMPAVVGNLVIRIPDPVQIGISGLPLFGTIQIESVTEGFIDIVITTCPGGAGVRVVDDGEEVGCFTWNAFEELFETSTDPVEQLAAFGFSVIELLFEQVDFVVEILGVIDEEALDLERAGTITEMCDAFSDAGLSAPTNIGGRVVPDQGMRTLEWIDANANGQVGPGDNFVGTLTECWVNDPTDDIDELLDGVGNFRGYLLNEDPDREVITAIGFTSIAPSAPGGIVYSDFTISETEQVSPPDTTTEIIDVIGLSGGVSVLFTE